MQSFFQILFLWEGYMSLPGLLVLLGVAAVCGSIGAGIAGYSTRGCLTNIVLGFIGAIIGSWLSRELGMPLFVCFLGIPVIWSIIGAALFVVLLRLLTGKRQRKRG
jgi:uncharacterized membrane protein YeaQ/YmgE (transglycosylase-associated protein family)